MKQILLIKPHSFIDVITNSSTELFVCAEDKTMEMVEQLISEYAPKATWYSLRYPNEHELVWSKYKDKIVDVKDQRWYTKKTLYKKDVAKKDIPLLHFRKDEEYATAGRDYVFDLTPQTVILEGDWDNELPYMYFDLFESILEASRYHLG